MKIRLMTLIGCCVLSATSMAVSIQEIEQSKQCKAVTFQLPANPTTGYSWKVVDYNHARFKKGKEGYESPDKKLIGAGGKMTFTFNKIDKEDTGKDAVFLMAYGQAWNKQSYDNTVIVVKFVDKPCK